LAPEVVLLLRLGEVRFSTPSHTPGPVRGTASRGVARPGCGRLGKKLASFTDVRDLQRQLKAQGVQLQQQADEGTTGPASFVAIDPDGNPIRVDQPV